MVTGDLAIRYRDLYQKAEHILANIQETGFDVSEYREDLKGISDNVKKEVKASGSKGYARAHYEMDYSKGINALNALIHQLDKYDVYCKVLNSCEWLNIKLDDKDMTEQQLKEYISEVAYNLKQLVKSDTCNYDSEKHIVEKVCETAYKLIKIELMMTGNSNLYTYIKQEEINLSYFSAIVKNEYLKAGDDVKNNIFIREIIFAIRKNGINANYFDLDLIKGLITCGGNNRFKEEIDAKIHMILRKLEYNKITLTNLIDENEYDESNAKEYSSNIKINRRNIRNRIMTFLLAMSIMIGGGVGIQRLCKKESTGNKYLKTTEVYSTITDDVTVKTNEIVLETGFGGGTPTEKTIVRAYEPYKNDSIRDYQEYDVSYLNFDELYEYYEYGEENYGVVPERKTLNTRNGDTISDYENSYAEVSKTTFEYLDEGIDKNSYVIGLLICYMIYLLPIALLETAYLVITDCKSIIIGSILELYEETKYLLSNREYYKKYKYRVDENLNKMLELINQNDKLKEEFKRLYETNKYLLDNPDELYKRFNKIDDSEVKKLIKEKKK